MLAPLAVVDPRRRVHRRDRRWLRRGDTVRARRACGDSGAGGRHGDGHRDGHGRLRRRGLRRRGRRCRRLLARRKRQQLGDPDRRAVAVHGAVLLAQEQHHGSLDGRSRPERQRRAVLRLEHTTVRRDGVQRPEREDEPSRADVAGAVELVRERRVPVARRADAGRRGTTPRERVLDGRLQVLPELATRRVPQRRHLDEEQRRGDGRAAQLDEARLVREPNLASRAGAHLGGLQRIHRVELAEPGPRWPSFRGRLRGSSRRAASPARAPVPSRLALSCV